MTVEINGQRYYRTIEVCKTIGVSRATLFRWLKEGILLKSYRDGKGWRLFTEDNVNTIRTKANRVQTTRINELN